VFLDATQIIGSLLILGGFVAALMGHLDQASYPYLIANAVGSAILTATAVPGLEWGFILLEGVWALVSLYSIARKLTGRPVAAAH
jgi:hypothetical protein